MCFFLKYQFRKFYVTVACKQFNHSSHQKWTFLIAHSSTWDILEKQPRRLEHPRFRLPTIDGNPLSRRSSAIHLFSLLPKTDNDLFYGHYRFVFFLTTAPCIFQPPISNMKKYKHVQWIFRRAKNILYFAPTIVWQSWISCFILTSLQFFL